VPWFAPAIVVSLATFAPASKSAMAARARRRGGRTCPPTSFAPDRLAKRLAQDPARAIHTHLPGGTGFMPTNHIVKRGEHLSAISVRYGFQTNDPIWNHPGNAELRQRRNRNVLFEGDVLVIPELLQRSVERATGLTHRFIIKRSKLRLRLVVQSFAGRPARELPIKFEVGGNVIDAQTDAEGAVEIAVPRDASEAILIAQSTSLSIKIGAMDPIDSVSGVDMRLANLGYLAGPLDQVGDAERRLALEEFQLENGVPVTGERDDATRTKLTALHGT
jgi:hypothetical protein